MEHRFTAVTAFVLAGGESRRMGEPKQDLILGGETMLERQVRLLSRVCRSVAVVGPAGDRAWTEVPFLPDPIRGRGPLGGIYSGLVQTRAEYNLFLACDLPFIEGRFLTRLMGLATQGRADVTLPEDKHGRLQPLCAIYRRKTLGVIRARLTQDSNKTDGYFGCVRLRVMPWQEIVRAGFSAHIFDNINRPEDFEEAKLRLGAV